MPITAQVGINGNLCCATVTRSDSYKTLPNHVVVLDADEHEIGIVFKTTTPFDTPREMEALIAWTRKAIKAIEEDDCVAIFSDTFWDIRVPKRS